MQVYIFKAGSNLCGFTPEESGDNLPGAIGGLGHCLSPLRYSKTILLRGLECVKPTFWQELEAKVSI
jgi:hypothetical protein